MVVVRVRNEKGDGGVESKERWRCASGGGSGEERVAMMVEVVVVNGEEGSSDNGGGGSGGSGGGIDGSGGGGSGGGSGGGVGEDDVNIFSVHTPKSILIHLSAIVLLCDSVRHESDFLSLIHPFHTQPVSEGE